MEFLACEISDRIMIISHARRPVGLGLLRWPPPKLGRALKDEREIAEGERKMLLAIDICET